jgi:hypothetical protein
MDRVNRTGLLTAWLITFILLGPALVRGQNLVVGVNVVNPMRASVADQNALLDQLKAASVHVIRCGISNDDKGIDFAKRAAAHGISLQLIVSAEYLPNAPSRPYQPDQFPANVGRPSTLMGRSHCL